ncbi:MAG: lipoprotein signal peptidase [Dysgonamonadaceae bacterium]|jgi:signal peptidase II|nr:lipoprotein signal peptidase [Dysgonamonadaceae bacterium]
MKKSKGLWIILIILLILVADQALKIWIKTHLMLYQEIRVADWFYIRFVENNGMAMGIEVVAKIFLTFFRIIASFGIVYYLWRLLKRGFKMGYIVCIALIFAGAVGNIFDSIFYGVIFNDSPVFNEYLPFETATLFPPEGGYSSWFQGKVVDMFYFPLFEFNWPSWIPFFGGEKFVFFQYIFNIADASISVGIIVLILFYRQTFSISFEKKKKICS